MMTGKTSTISALTNPNFNDSVEDYCNQYITKHYIDIGVIFVYIIILMQYF